MVVQRGTKNGFGHYSSWITSRTRIRLRYSALPPPPPKIVGHVAKQTTQARGGSTGHRTYPELSIQKAFRFLKLETYTKEELDAVFDTIRSIPIDTGDDETITNDRRPMHGHESSQLPIEDDTPGSGKTHHPPLPWSVIPSTEHDRILLSQIQLYFLQRIREETPQLFRFENDVRRVQEYSAQQAQVFIDLLHGPFHNTVTSTRSSDSSSSSSSSSTTTTTSTTPFIPPPPPSAPYHQSPGSVTREHFVRGLLHHARRIDYQRTWPIAVSMLLVGASVGVITPAMPFVVEQLGLTPGQYGTVVSAFGLAKMSGNIPAAIAVERHGRKPYLTYSLVVIALGAGGIGWAESFEQLYLCRLLTGFGVAALSAAGTLMVTDLSTPLNRASTLAPIMSAFAAGTALGPAMGGYLVDQVGLQTTFATVGVSYIGVAAVNRMLLQETKAKMLFTPPPPPPPPPSLPNERLKVTDEDAWDVPSLQNTPSQSWFAEAQNAVAQWIPLARNPKVRTVFIMNGFYWISLAGAQMTILPLILTDPTHGFAMTATQVGQVYMGMSTIQIIGNPIFARLADRIGKVPAIIGGCTFISLAMASLPLIDCTNPVHLATTIGIWSMGSSMVSTAPIAYISDQVPAHQRAQAIAFLRTTGDVGFLIGAAGTGTFADWTRSLDVAMQASAGLLLAATNWFTVRQYISSRQQSVKTDS